MFPRVVIFPAHLRQEGNINGNVASSCVPSYRQHSPEYLITSSSRTRHSDCAYANMVQREGLIS